VVLFRQYTEMVPISNIQDILYSAKVVPIGTRNIREQVVPICMYSTAVVHLGSSKIAQFYSDDIIDSTHCRLIASSTSIVIVSDCSYIL